MKRDSLILGHFRDKRNISNKTMLVDKDKIRPKDKNVAEITNKYSLNITKPLKIIEKF